MAPEVARPLPPYLQIADDIAARIRSGEIAEGGSIPSARQIAATWGVAIATASKVHAHLRASGLVRSVSGVGTVVSTTGNGHGAQQRGIRTRDQGLIYEAGEVAEIVSAELVAASELVATALGVPEGAEVIRRQRITRQDGAPVSSSVSWFAGDLATRVPELLRRERVLQGTFAVVAERLGRTLASGREEVAASSAGDDDAARLDVVPGSPILLSRNWFQDQDGDVIEYGESVRRADRWSAHDFRLS